MALIFPNHVALLMIESMVALESNPIAKPFFSSVSVFSPASRLFFKKRTSGALLALFRLCVVLKQVHAPMTERLQ
jgi:hypothetical protein